MLGFSSFPGIDFFAVRERVAEPGSRKDQIQPGTGMLLEGEPPQLSPEAGLQIALDSKSQLFY